MPHVGLPADTLIEGWCQAEEFRLSPGGTVMDAANLGHQHVKTIEWAAHEYISPAASRRVIHSFSGSSGSLRFCGIGSRVPCVGDSTVTVDIQKNGATVLSATVTLTSASVAYTAAEATLSATSCVDGDVIEAVVSCSAGTGTPALGLYVVLAWNEDYV